MIDQERLHHFLHDFEEKLGGGNYAGVRELTAQFLDSDLFNAHFGHNLAEELSRIPELLDLAEQVIQRSIDASTPELLARLGPELGSTHQQKLELGRLLSLRGWAFWKQRRIEEGLSVINEAIEYKGQTAGQDAQDVLRLGILTYHAGERQAGWSLLKEAVLMDTSVEDADPEYRRAIDEIIALETSDGESSGGFLSRFRRENATPLPETAFRTEDGRRTTLADEAGEATFVDFFSPACSSSRQQISSLGAWYDELLLQSAVKALFILNRPELWQEARRMMADACLRSPTMLTVADGSAYVLIAGEPTVWIVDEDGLIRFRHSGYEPGDEAMYRKELLELLG